MQEQVLIIGAGAAGLYAGYLLSKTHNVKIIEARNYTGGRIFSQKLNGSIVEKGAEFIHGDAPLTKGLLRKAGINYKTGNSIVYRRNSKGFTEQDEMIDGWDELINKMEAAEPDVTLNTLLKTHYHCDPEFGKQVKLFAAGFDLADAEKVSVKALVKEWRSQDEDVVRIPDGYSKLIEFLHNNIEKNKGVVLTSQFVNQVKWSPNKVSVHTNDKVFTGSKIIITVPVPVMTSEKISFSPEIIKYINAYKDIGFGSVIKLGLQFKKPFWQKDAAYIISDEIIPTWWPHVNDPSMIIGWVGGPPAKLLYKQSDVLIIKEAIHSLSRLYDIDHNILQDELTGFWVSDWHKDPYSCGGYSYAYPGSEAARKLLNTPVEETIYFSGEGVYAGESPGTVEAALKSGKDVAERTGLL